MDTKINITISQAIAQYLSAVEMARSPNTARTYRNALNAFSETLETRKIHLRETFLRDLSEDAVSWFAQDLKYLSPATEQLYLGAAAGFYDYLVAERLADYNLPRVRLLIRHRGRKPGTRLPQFPQSDIEKVLKYAIEIADTPNEDRSHALISLRDRAFILTLADTGLRVHEACNLRRGDIDWNEGKAIIIGKGDRQAVVRFSTRSLEALRDYLARRAEIDGATRKPLASLPLFARHDRGAGLKIKPLSTASGRNIVKQRVSESLGEQAVGSITPHSFRHYFVTTVLRGTGGNLKMAQELARHRNIAVTQRYAHLSADELDKGYYEIFDQKKNKEI